MRPAEGLLDTSVLIARESGRPLEAARLPEYLAISIVTLAELYAGVLLATDIETRSRRMVTLDGIVDMRMFLVDPPVAVAWSRLRVHLAESGKRVNVNDLWIAATALANDFPVVTQDADFDPLEGVSGLEVVRV